MRMVMFFTTKFVKILHIFVIIIDTNSKKNSFELAELDPATFSPSWSYLSQLSYGTSLHLSNHKTELTKILSCKRKCNLLCHVLCQFS